VVESFIDVMISPEDATATVAGAGEFGSSSVFSFIELHRVFSLNA
jgi:hypothetical protein